MNLDKYLKVLDYNHLWDEELEDLMYDFIIKINNRLVYRCIKPKHNCKKNYVGIEIEFLSTKSEDELCHLIVNNNLVNKVTLTEDASIDCKFPYRGYEFRILDTEKNIIKTTAKVLKLLKQINATTNDTCGIHVHIDGRNRNYSKLFDNFFTCQRFLYSLVAESRQNNDYCKFRSVEDYSNHHDEHYFGVSRATDKNTIEIRMLQSTLDVKKVSLWIKLLIKIANRKTRISQNVQILPSNDVKRRLVS